MNFTMVSMDSLDLNLDIEVPPLIWWGYVWAPMTLTLVLKCPMILTVVCKCPSLDLNHDIEVPPLIWRGMYGPRDFDCDIEGACEFVCGMLRPPYFSTGYWRAPINLNVVSIRVPLDLNHYIEVPHEFDCGI